MSRKMTPSEATAYYREIAQQIKKVTQSTIKVGVVNGQDRYEPRKDKNGQPIGQGALLIDVAAAHEYGIGTKRRSFLRMPFAVKSKELQGTIDEALGAVVDGRMSADMALEAVGVKAQIISQGAFDTRGYGNWEDISDTRKAEKKSTQVLIDTGKLRQSIVWEVK